MNAQKLEARPWSGLPPALGTTLRPALPALTEEIIEAIRVEVPAYRRPLEGNFGAGVRTGVEQALGWFVDMVEHPDADVPDRREVYAALGAGEAREGRTLDALMSAYRIGARVAWRRLALSARAAEVGAETLALLAESIFAYIDEISAISAEGYTAGQAEVAGELDRRRRNLVLALLSSPPPDEAEARAEARRAGWDPPRQLAALVWHEDGGRPVAPRLPPDAITGRYRDELRCALIPDPDGPGRRGEIERAVGERPAGLGSTAPWLEAARSASRAADALALAERGVVSGGLVCATDHMPELVAHGQPEVLSDLATAALTPLDDETPASRARLLLTLGAWLDHQGSPSAVARALHVHPQTVRYRLGRLRECFGDRLDDPSFRFELSLAVRAPAS